MAKEKADRKRRFIAFVAFFPALIFTGLVVIPSGILFEHLELKSKLKLPESVAELAVIAAAGLFFLFWTLSYFIAKAEWFSSEQVEAEEEE
jgi:hypothetical protein